MGAIEDVRNLMQDIVAPDIKAIKAQLTALEKRVDGLDKKMDANHNEVLAAIGRIVDYKDVIQRLNKLEEKLPKQ